MSTVLYTITTQNKLFDGANDLMQLNRNEDCRYKGNNRKKSLELARRYADNDLIEVRKYGILHSAYKWSKIEYSNEHIISRETKIFDPLDRFERIKKIATRAHLFSVLIAKFKNNYDYDLISYIVGTRELIGNGVCKYNDHWIDLYRYKTSAFGDFTAYEDNGHLWLPEDFNDYGIMNPDKLTLAMNEGVMFWTDYQIDDPEMKLMYRIFKNRSL